MGWAASDMFESAGSPATFRLGELPGKVEVDDVADAAAARHLARYTHISVMVERYQEQIRAEGRQSVGSHTGQLATTEVSAASYSAEDGDLLGPQHALPAPCVVQRPIGRPIGRPISRPAGRD